MLKPTQRFKQRYVSFRLSCEGAPLPAKEAKELVHSHFLSFFGEAGIAGLAFKLIRYDQESGSGILRCERGRTEEAIFCMGCLSGWNGRRARLEPLSTSGTIRRL